MSKNQLVAIHENLDKLLEAKREAMPKGFNKTRFMQNCMTVLQDTKEIEKCDPVSVARTMLKGAFLGLDFFNKECYAIPYNENIGTKENPKWIKALQFQTDYKGEKKLAKKYSVRAIKDIYAKLVRKDDVFIEEIKDGQPTIHFRPKPFNDGEILGAFAVALFKDGGMMYEVMSVADMELTRKNYSKQANGQAWSKSSGEMYKKTVLRRLCKHIDISFDSIEQSQAFEDGGDLDLKKEVQPEQVSPLENATVIDAEIIDMEIVNEANEG